MAVRLQSRGAKVLGIQGLWQELHWGRKHFEKCVLVAARDSYDCSVSVLPRTFNHPLPLLRKSKKTAKPQLQFVPLDWYLPEEQEESGKETGVARGHWPDLLYVFPARYVVETSHQCLQQQGPLSGPPMWGFPFRSNHDLYEPTYKQHVIPSIVQVGSSNFPVFTPRGTIEAITAFAT